MPDKRILLSAAVACLLLSSCAPPVNVTTQHNDNFRTGANLQEKFLTVSNVRCNFGKLFSRTVLGAVYAQPLILTNVESQRGRKNLVFIATMHDMVYAFDASDPTQTDPVWFNKLGDSVRLPDSEIGGGDNYRDISYEVGIVGTPVIDAANQALYVVALTFEHGHRVHRIHKLSVSNGSEMAPARVIGGSFTCGGNTKNFESKAENQRPALLLAFGSVYVAFASFGDNGPYFGWVFAFDPGDLHQKAIFNTTACESDDNKAAGGIWMAGQGLAADEFPRGGKPGVFFMTGNGAFSKNGEKLGDSMVKLNPDLTFADFFSPFNNSDLSGADQDLGAGGVLLIPGSTVVVGGGKQGKLYVVDRNKMGGFNTKDDSQIVQSFLVWASGSGTHHIHGSPVFWNGPMGPTIYLWAENDALRAFNFDGLRFNVIPSMVNQTREPDQVAAGASGMPGGFLSISANGNQAGTGVLWANHPYKGDSNQQIVPGILRAYDATDLSSELWNSHLNLLRDDLGNYSKFSAPTVANGKVYVAGMGGLENKVVFDESDHSGPALASMGARLAVGWTGLDNQVNIATTLDGLSLVTKVTGELSNNGPALCFGGGKLFLAWTGTDDHLNVIQSVNGIGWASKVTLGEKSHHAPALACGGGNIFLAWTGTDDHVNVAQSFNGINWSTPPPVHPLNESSPSGPWLTWNSGNLFLFWTGNDNHLNVRSSTVWPNFPTKNTLGETSDHRPAAIVGNDKRSYLAWVGQDSNHSLNLQVSDAFGLPDYKAVYNDNSENDIALEVFRQRVYVAWTGADSHLNLAVLSPGEFHVFGLL